MVTKLFKHLLQPLKRKIVGPEEPDTLRLDAQGKREKIKESFSHLRHINAEDIMTPRADIDSVPDTITFEALISAFQDTGHSRLPVYSTTLDSIYGMIHIKDLLPYVFTKKKFLLSKCMRDILFISPSITLDELLLDMQQSLTHMALIVDEHGGIDGLITIENVLEELVGDIRDEHEEPHIPLVEIITAQPFVCIAQGKAPLDLIETTVGCTLLPPEDEDIVTLGGYLLDQLNALPKEGDIMREPSIGLQFEILAATPRMIQSVKISMIPPASETLPH